MKIIILGAFLSLSSMAGAQVADMSGVKIRSLFDARSRQPGVQIPFQFSGKDVEGGVLRAASVTGGSAAADCKISRDPFRSDVAFLKCDAEADVQMHLEILVGNRVVKTTVAPIAVKLPAPNLVVVDPVDPGVVDYKNGLSLFSAKCVSCHNPPSAKKNATDLRIRGAIAGVPMMNGSMMDRSRGQNGVDLRKLTNEEIRILVIYLKNP